MSFRQLGGEAALYGVGRAAEGAIQFAALFVVARALSPAEIGVADIVAAYASLAFFLTGFNLDQALTRYYYESDARSLASTHLGVIVATSVVLVVCGSAAVLLQRPSPEMRTVWILALLTVPVTVFTEHFAAILRLRHQASSHLTLVIARPLVWAVTTILLLLLANAGIAAIFAGRLIAGIAALALVGGRFAGTYVRQIRWTYLLRGLRFALPTLPAAIASWAILHGQRYYLGAVTTVEEVGYYGIAVRFGYFLSFFGLAVVMAWGPFVMKMKEQSDAPGVIGKSLLYFAMANAAIATPLCLFAREAVLVVVGEQYLPAATLVGTMATALVFSNLSLFLFVQVSISERTFWQSVSYAAGVGAMMSANVFLVPMFAAEGAVVATMAAYMVVAATMFWAAQRHFRAHVDIVRLVLVLFAVLCVAVSARVLGEPRLGFPMDLLVKALLTLGVWGVLLSIIGVRDLQSIRVLWRRLIAVTQDEDGAEATDGS